MKAKDFFFKYYGLFFGIFCVLANIFAVLLASNTSFVLPDSECLNLWHDFINAHSTFINSVQILCYIIPSIFCVIYTLQMRKCRPADEKYIRITVHLPGMYALFSVIGWLINFLIELVLLFYLRGTTGVDNLFIIISSASSMFFLAMISFTIIFFTLETLNRNVILPHLYPDGNISATQRMSISSIRNMFLFYFFSTAFFPTAFLGIRIFMSVRYELALNGYSDVIVSLFLLLIGLVLTVVFSNFFSKPLKKLTRTADRISEGDYDCKTNICSNDEMGVLSDSFNAMAKSLKEKEFMRDTFGKIVTPQVRDYLLGGNVALGGESLEVTVMFCDIRGFTTLSESMEPERIVSLLNTYFTGLEECITAHNGVINKYIGDAIMALFGAPVRLSNHAQQAFEAALAMRQALVKMNEGFLARGLPSLRFGIGLHSGSVLAGNIGAANRMEYTVIGDAVNTASRLEGLCKLYKTDLLVSESTMTRLSSEMTFVDEADIRGRVEKVKVYTF